MQCIWHYYTLVLTHVSNEQYSHSTIAQTFLLPKHVCWCVDVISASVATYSIHGYKYTVQVCNCSSTKNLQSNNGGHMTAALCTWLLILLFWNHNYSSLSRVCTWTCASLGRHRAARHTCHWWGPTSLTWLSTVYLVYSVHTYCHVHVHVQFSPVLYQMRKLNYWLLLVRYM